MAKKREFCPQMPNWINENTTLKGRTIDLVPLDNSHLPALTALAQDKRIWQHYTYDISKPENFTSSYAEAFALKDQGCQFPFAIVNKANGNLIGSTRFLDIQQSNRKLEIGWTWLHPDYWGSGINLECKLLLLTFAFEYLHAIRVQLKTDENNIR